MDDEIDSLKEGSINEEVIDIAIDLHAALVVISNKFSSEAVIDFIPIMTALLNKFDASLKGLDLIEAADINTNILVSAIPFRYDLPFMNDDICFANSAIQKRLITIKESRQ
ncbi:hypothetical protein LSTR_LSTR013806 [Laodelphax striatellus]|uniref:Uncharacterized protein n=1 Tax=Laodelphax striatellus TaxID=195883 RepID=A0A482XQI1_LAOST|nr:hypothetical protein LSTR_LSTR013806 [Laodelphax striatellus]